MLIDVPNNKLYMVFPAYDKLTCWVGAHAHISCGLAQQELGLRL